MENSAPPSWLKKWVIALTLVASMGLASLFLVSTPNSAQPPILATPTPTPVFYARRNYDPPAPPDLFLSAQAVPIQTADKDGQPQIVKLWGGYEDRVGIDFYAQYDVLISQSFSHEQLLYLRAKNPELTILHSGIGTYDADNGPLGSQWLVAQANTPEFECFYRGTNNQVLKVDYWNHGMFNMSNDWCTDAIVEHLASEFAPEIHQGVFFDRVTQVITPFILDGIDVDHDGRVDDRDSVNAAYWRGTERFLDKVRQRLGNEVILIANDAPLMYASRLNGREYEMFIRDILDMNKSWPSFRYNYEQWMQSARTPALSMVMANPPLWLEQKYDIAPYLKMKEAVVDETASYYQRMRFGLTTALMEGGLYSFEFGATWHGNAWWYDEYDGAGLGKGYLGNPVGQAYYATGPLTSPNAVQNPDFEAGGVSPWILYTEGAQATLQCAEVSGPHGLTTAARISIESSNQLEAVAVRQKDLSLEEGQDYTLAFWAKTTVPLWNVKATLHQKGHTGTLYGLDKRQEMGTTWQQYWIPFTATATANDAVLSLAVGQYVGTVWIDEVRLQQGTLPTVFRRDFEHGIVLCNATKEAQYVHLDRPYRKINGSQAPRAQVRVDDKQNVSEAFTTTGGWAGHEAGYDEWGDTYHHALTTTDPHGIQSTVTWRPNIPFTDQYTVYVWLAPHAKCDDIVTYIVEHAAGQTSVSVDPRVSDPQWANLGTFPLAAGTENSVTLTNLTSSTWVVADVVKFESMTRYNDGAQVTSITLEPQDGIILLNELPYQVYLPLIANRN